MTPSRPSSRIGALAPGALTRAESLERLDRAASGDALATSRAFGDARERRPRVMLFHCGGTLGMGVESFREDADADASRPVPVRGGGVYRPLGASEYLLDISVVVPELRDFAEIEVEVLMNKDSSEMRGEDWATLARALDARREDFDAFIVAHGTDTMAYTASALSLMLVGFNKPIVLTGSQLPLGFARSDARQNLIDALTCCVASKTCGGAVDFYEVAICFSGKLLRGNRAQKTSATVYAAFSSPSYPALARLGVGVDWNHARLLPKAEKYTPRFEFDSRVIRIPIIPGIDMSAAYGDVHARGIRGIVLEAFGVGNFPATLMPWLTDQTSKGVRLLLTTQCSSGILRPELYAAGLGAIAVGAKSGPVMTIECAVVKLMLHLADPTGIDLHRAISGEAETVDFCGN